MSTSVIADVLPFLSEISGRDKKWDLRKSEANRLAQLYKGTHLDRLYERILICAEELRFELESGVDESNLKLKSARFCRVRHCPICQWRRQRMWFGRFVNTLPKMLEDYPSAKFLHLTLTTRNCDVKNLRATLADMNKAWTRLSQRKQFKTILGWVRAVEITRNTDKDSWSFDTAHPHFHVLLMVKPSYFTGKSYVSHTQWVQTWRECLRVDYDPTVHVQVIKPKNPLPSSLPKMASVPSNAVPVEFNPDGTPKVTRLPQEMAKAVSEVVKYAVKPQDLVLGGEWLLTLTDQLRGTKAIALGGVMKDYIQAPDEDDEELITAGLESEEATVGEVEPVVITFGWRERLKHYQQQA